MSFSLRMRKILGSHFFIDVKKSSGALLPFSIRMRMNLGGLSIFFSKNVKIREFPSVF